MTWARAEYKLTSHDAITVDAMATRGEYLRNGASDYVDFDGTSAVIGRFTQLTDALSRSGTEDVVAGFRRTGPASAPTFSVEMHVTRTHSDADNGLASLLYLADASTVDLGVPAGRETVPSGLPAYVAQAD